MSSISRNKVAHTKVQYLPRYRESLIQSRTICYRPMVHYRHRGTKHGYTGTDIRNRIEIPPELGAHAEEGRAWPLCENSDRHSDRPGTFSMRGEFSQSQLKACKAQLSTTNWEFSTSLSTWDFVVFGKGTYTIYL
jgi:hypothetical protein